MKKSLFTAAAAFAAVCLSIAAVCTADARTGDRENPVAVFIGNSITENWLKFRPEFFSSNNYVGKGISGQTSSDILERFEQDVLMLEPDVVVIGAGTNDIAENDGPYDEQETLSHIARMASMADSAGIKVILASALPAKGFRWRPQLDDAPQKILSLNKKIRNLAGKEGYGYADYYTPMADDNGWMKEGLSEDGVHPFPDSYRIMEDIVVPLIRERVPDCLPD